MDKNNSKNFLIIIFIIQILFISGCCSSSISNQYPEYRATLTNNEIKILNKANETFYSPCCTKKKLNIDGNCPLRQNALNYIAYRITQSDTFEELKSEYEQRFINMKKFNFDLSSAPSIGSKQSPINIVIFYDFSCPHCRRAIPSLLSLLEKHPQKIQIFSMFYPLTMEERSLYSMKVALAAAKQNKFWQIQEILFQLRGRITPEDIESLSQELELDYDILLEDIEDEEILNIVLSQREQGEKAGIQGTPTVFINGVKFNDSLQGIETIINEELIRLESNIEPQKCR